MSKVSIVLPCYNEEENVVPLSEAIIEVFKKDLPDYDYELLFIDNFSKDTTRAKLTVLCQNNKKIKAIFNARNFGHIRSPYYALTQATGDCAMLMCTDFQDPVELIPEFVKKWEEGNKIVIGIKNKSRENPIMYFCRKLYYGLIKKISDTEQIKQFTGFGLYDKSFINVLASLEDPMPYMRGIVAELGYRRAEIKYTQPRRRAGKTKNNWGTLYDMAMIGITSYSKKLMRMATVMGCFMTGLSFVAAIVYVVLKLVYWEQVPVAFIPSLLAIFFMGNVLLAFIGLLGEYTLNINTRVMKRPLVIEECRLNFEEE